MDAGLLGEDFLVASMTALRALESQKFSGGLARKSPPKSLLKELVTKTMSDAFRALPLIEVFRLLPHYFPNLPATSLTLDNFSWKISLELDRVILLVAGDSQLPLCLSQNFHLVLSETIRILNK